MGLIHTLYVGYAVGKCVILCSLVILEFQIFKQGVVEFNILPVCEGKEIDQYYQQIIKCIQCSF